MTTVAASTLTMTMACDSMGTDGALRKYVAGPKIVKIHHGSRAYLVGSAGTQKTIDKYLNWAESKEDFENLVCPLNPGPDDERSVHIILKDDGKLYTVDSLFHSNENTEPFWSIGSGGAEALGALYAERHPDEAVAIASYIDLHTGGQIYDYSFTTDEPSVRWPDEIWPSPIANQQILGAHISWEK